MPELIEVWTVEMAVPHPVKEFCEVFGYPHQTTCGKVMYVNSHYLTEAEAWEKWRKDNTLHLEYLGSRVIEAREALAKCNEAAADQAALLAEGADLYEAFLRRTGTPAA